MEDLIESIRFPSLRNEGPEVNGWVSAGSDQYYPRGEGTPTANGTFGVMYVLRGPGSTYALDLEPDGCGEGESETWDPARLQILIQCPDGHDVRYERDGTPVPGNPASFTQTLAAYPVITAWDGTLLVSTRAMTSSDARGAWEG
jgi:hypothetical protein